MRHQVTVAEYGRCVAAGACQELAPLANRRPDSPAVRVSWQDATAYAAWLSAATGEVYRLPTDEEWIYVAGSRANDDGLGEAEDADDPSKAWLAKYDQDTLEESRPDGRTRSVGGFGVNEFGLLDLSGSVWEWTNTCFTRRSLDEAGRPLAAPVINCGVRVVEGRHRAYVPDFVRDARTGGCSGGYPPFNLGFRLVRAGAHSAARLASVSSAGEPGP
jgi:formylglycine-generating enzyme required for sulfatase activity